MKLSDNLSTIDSAYKRASKKLSKLGLVSVEDLLYHIPSRYLDYSLITPIASVQPGEVITIRGKITSFKTQYLRGSGVRNMQKAILEDESETIELTWFNQPFLQRILSSPTQFYMSGKVTMRAGKKVMLGPEYEPIGQNSLHTGRLVPIYPETKGLSSKWLRVHLYQLLSTLQKIPDFMPESTIREYKLVSLDTALRNIHFPSSNQDVLLAKRRLGFDELFLIQLDAKLKRIEWETNNSRKPFEITKFENKIRLFIDSLPFTLTGDQENAIRDISADLKMNKPMNRLLQGDVGSGKTIVSAVAMYYAFLNGMQSILMAPTQLLAKQHFETITLYLAPLGITVRLIVGGIKSGSQNTRADIYIGTHSVLSKNIQYTNVGLIVIDEQQRFGVAQRTTLRKIAQSPHVLTMTATPIPRTIALTYFGDLDVSEISQMPGGRKIVKTWLVPAEKRENAYIWIEKELKKNAAQAYVVCPFIDESESIVSVKAAKSEYERLRTKVFPNLRIGLLHGGLKPKQTEEVLLDFREKKFDILVATPVVEVGIDVENATIIVIEGSDRFGLSQLHQLRGRVGRGQKQSYCLLFYDSGQEPVLKRLKALETTYSGKKLSELDLQLRGPGNLYGTSQHGILKGKAADFTDTHLIHQTQKAADTLLPKITSYPLLSDKLATIHSSLASPD